MKTIALQFPVLCLNRNITKFIMEIAGPDLRESIYKGLQNQIKLIDLRSSITTPAEIVNIDSFNYDNCEVRLSAAFCQYVWFICDIVLKLLDRQILEQCARASNMGLNKFIKTSLKTFKSFNTISGLQRYYECVESFGKLDFNSKIRAEASLCNKLILRLSHLPMRPFQAFKPRGKYEERVNSTYCFAIALILLHEHGHYDLGHMKIQHEETSHEVEADQSAIWTSLLYEAKDKRFSMNCGILLGFFSLLMLNPTLSSDGIHPSELQRLTDFYELIKNEYPKYTELYNFMIRIWESYGKRLDCGQGLAEVFESFL